MDRKLRRWLCAVWEVALAATCVAGTLAVGPARADCCGASESLPLYGHLDGVAATSASNAWAVGEGVTSSGGFLTLILRWNGTPWKKVPIPGPPGGLLGVAATSARNAWAVGITTILHWNGLMWKRVSAPRGISLDSVAATSAGNAFAVGQTAIVRWKGKAWKRIRSPSPPGAQLTAVAATSARNAWAVGWWQPPAGGLTRTLILHWNGTAWKEVPSPNAPGNDLPGGVAALSPDNAWAVGAPPDAA
jgi:hypothetical protein